jgi:uncharacterized membrane protein (DUF485 family)
MTNKKELEFVDTPEEVDRHFRAQLKLSITYGIIFFISVLLIPFLSITAEWWYGREIWGGFTPNYLVVALLFNIFYVLLGYFYARQANALEDKLMGSGKKEVKEGD